MGCPCSGESEEQKGHIVNVVEEVCKIGCGAECCRYLMMGTRGFECAKVDIALKRAVDHAWATTPHVAQGDNCPGKNSLVLNLKPEEQN